MGPLWGLGFESLEYQGFRVLSFRLSGLDGFLNPKLLNPKPERCHRRSPRAKKRSWPVA